jgi:phytanoyl-CoA hydroxylase
MRASKHQVEQYLTEGFLVVPDIVSSEEVATLRTEIARFARAEYPVENPRSSNTYGSDEALLRSILAINFPHRVSPVTRRFATHAGVVEILRAILAAHLPYWDGSVKFVQSIFYNKPSGYQGQPWHQDELFIPTRDRSLTGAWIALDAATVDSGCLWMIRGSHRSGYLWPTRLTAGDEEYVCSDESYGFDEDAAVPVEVEAGSVVFFNGYLLHSSRRNRSDTYRRALVNHYCSASTLLPWPSPPRLVDSAMIPQLDNRAVIVIGTDPYAWKGVEESTEQVFLRPFE